MNEQERTITTRPIHHAIDDATALKLELRRMRQGLQARIAVDEDRLDQLEALIDMLAVHLLECRDGELSLDIR